MTNTYDQLRPHYDHVRGMFPLFPDNFVTIEDSDFGEAFFHGLTPGGLPIFQGAVNYNIPQKTAYHECGHAYEALLKRRDPARDWRTLYWAKRGFPGTWQQAYAEAEKYTGMAQWVWLPGESWAEAFANAVYGYFVGEKTMDYGKGIDPIGMRAFFLELGGVMATVDYAGANWVAGVPGSAFMRGRSGNPITLIVDHWTAGSLAAAIATFRAGPNSAHYIVAQDGHIVQMVSEKDTAFHCGNFNLNQLSIGIEHEAGPTVLPSDAQYAASAKLHADIARRYDIDLSPTTVRRHDTIVPTQCPGTLSILRILEIAQGEEMDAEDKALLRAIAENTKGLYDVMNAFAKVTFPVLLDRLGDSRDVATGGPDKTVSNS